jgi:hypothetical protein
MKTLVLLNFILILTFQVADAPIISTPHQRDAVLRCQSDHVVCTADCANWYFVNPICSSKCNQDLEECYGQFSATYQN